MSAAVYLTGIESIDEMETSEALDNFVSRVLATTNVMWAAANFSEVNMSEDIGKVANDLYSEALYLRRRLDRQLEERMKQIEKDRPELFEEETEPSDGGAS